MSIDRQENSTVLFADISGSTRLYVEVGDDRAREIVARTLDLWSALTVTGAACAVFPSPREGVVRAPTEQGGYWVPKTTEPPM